MSHVLDCETGQTVVQLKTSAHSCLLYLLDFDRSHDQKKCAAKKPVQSCLSCKTDVKTRQKEICRKHWSQSHHMISAKDFAFRWVISAGYTLPANAGASRECSASKGRSQQDIRYELTGLTATRGSPRLPSKPVKYGAGMRI